jgi:hypothetical protein
VLGLVDKRHRRGGCMCGHWRQRNRMTTGRAARSGLS